jgi:hypothetical protein
MSAVVFHYQLNCILQEQLVHKTTIEWNEMPSSLPRGLGHAVAQLVEALRYKAEGRGFDSRWCHWNFSLT